MTKLELTFNPYKKESTLAINGHVQTWARDRICGRNGNIFSSWACDFFRRAVQEFNDNVEVIFNGVQSDYEFLEKTLRSFEEPGSVLKQGKIFRPENITFDILIVGAMGVGKSTLIDSILGRKLLPTRASGSTTKTIVKIHDIDGMIGFNATAYDDSGKVVEKCDNLTIEDMNRLNDTPGTSIIELYGDIQGVESKDVKLVLTTDTSGLSNWTLEHQRLLDADLKSMIIYVLDVTSLFSNDNDYLIRKIASNMNQGDGQRHDRFLFVLNKADQLDPDCEQITTILDCARRYLSSHGIVNPRVMPISARLAKLIRQGRNATTTMAARDKRILDADIDWFVNESRMHLSDYARFLSPATELTLKTLIDDAKSNGDNETLVLLYSGVPSIEMAISEYINIFATPEKMIEEFFTTEGVKQ